MGLGWPVDPVSTRGLSLGPRLPQLLGSQGPCPHEHPQTRAERPAWKVTLLPVLCGSKQSHAHLDPRQEATGPIPGRQTKSRGHHFRPPGSGAQRWRHRGLRSAATTKHPRPLSSDPYSSERQGEAREPEMPPGFRAHGHRELLRPPTWKLSIAQGRAGFCQQLGLWDQNQHSTRRSPSVPGCSADSGQD